MAVDQNGNGLRYRDNQGKYSVYELVVQHRPVVEIVVDNDDSDLKIYVAKPGTVFSLVTGLSLDDGAPKLLETKGRARRGKHVKPEFKSVAEKFEGSSAEFINTYPDAIMEHIDGMSVYEFVGPRMLYILADVFVPKDGGFADSID